MTDIHDYAIAGSMPLAPLLAGELARTHGKKVIWIGSSPNPLRPSRGFDLSVGPLTRPDTWRLLRDSVPQTLKLLASIEGEKVFERVDPLFVAQTTFGAEALSHMRHVASGYGVAIERQPISDRYADACQFRDAQRILRRVLANALPQWLETSGVGHVNPSAAMLDHNPAGVEITPKEGEPVRAKNLILADEDAILAHTEPGEIDKFFRRVPLTALMFEPAAPLVNPVIHVIDTGLTIHQRGNGEIESVSALPLEEAGQAVWVQGNRSQRLALSGSASFSGLRTRHGGAVLGPLWRGGPVIITGFGTTGAFQVPAIARSLTGSSSADEAAYFAARTPEAQAKASALTEYVPGAEPEPLQ